MMMSWKMATNPPKANENSKRDGHVEHDPEQTRETMAMIDCVRKEPPITAETSS